MDVQIQRITVTGLVQGIGFRPYVAELAETLELTGQVKNLGGVVEIIIKGNQQAVDSFIHRLLLVSEKGELPGCRIDEIRVEDVEAGGEIPEAEANGNEEKIPAEGFRIVESGTGRERRRFLPADLPTCDRCVEEMHHPANRRYRYPFISCTGCGPRFSIQKAVPYDRETITMDAFPMCQACGEEYVQKGNIRRHAQTIACKDCGPELVYVTEQEETREQEVAIKEAAEALKNGKIGAIKDIGGYHFAFLPTCKEAAVRLREFKNRDKKPFAVMFLTVDGIREYCEVSAEEERVLKSSARPIVLLKKKKDFIPEICGESDRIGALLPCNPLQILLLEETGPLVMTSGNRGGEPIIITREEMEVHLKKGGVDFLLDHNREILTPLDDSIYQVTTVTGEERKQIIRRARGLVPEPIAIKRRLSEDSFAAGGDLKAVFALGRGELVYFSQYFGDLEDVRCMESRRKGLCRMKELLDIDPELMLWDMHPAYVSSAEAKEEIKEKNKKKISEEISEEISEKIREEIGNKKHLTGREVQHHHAHIASVMAEHGLEGPVLGIACDGTGYGTDGTIWGGEFLLCNEGEMTRCGYLSPVKLLGGDSSAKEADLTLLSYLLEAERQGMMLKEDIDGIFTGYSMEEGNLRLRRLAWQQNINTALSSSTGRLFDAAAALLDICHYNSYEGECAIKLEQAAHKGMEQSAHIFGEKPANILHLPWVKTDGIWQAPVVKLLVELWRLKDTYSGEVLAYLFHVTLAEALAEGAVRILKEQNVPGKEESTIPIALSGGTFINRILLGTVISTLTSRGYQVCINEKVPCGDGGIALGQMYLATWPQSEENKLKTR